MNNCNDPATKSEVRPLHIILLIKGFNRAFRYSDFRKELRSLIAWNNFKTLRFIHINVTMAT